MTSRSSQTEAGYPRETIETGTNGGPLRKSKKKGLPWPIVVLATTTIGKETQ